jgi:hypothetical protein
VRPSFSQKLKIKIFIFFIFNISYFGGPFCAKFRPARDSGGPHYITLHNFKPVVVDWLKMAQ